MNRCLHPRVAFDAPSSPWAGGVSRPSPVPRWRASRVPSAIFAMVMLCVITAGIAAAQVPVTFTLDQPGYVSLVAERVTAQGDTVRVRNIIQEASFGAGTHTVYWDGYDIGSVVHPNTPGQWYDIVRQPVDPGEYLIRGIYHQGIRERYEFSVYTPGSPPWHSFDGRGAWLSDHSFPYGATFIDRPGDPRLYFSSLNSEEGYSEIYTDLSGNKQWGSHGRGLGGRTGPGAFDAGTDRNQFDHYTASWWNEGGGMRLRIIGTYVDSPDHNPIWDTIFTSDFHTRSEQNWEQLAAHNKILVLSNFHRGVLHVLNADQWWNGNNYVGDVSIPDPKGVAFDASGRLLVVSGTTIRRFTLNPQGPSLTSEEVLVTGLQAPRQLAVDAAGNIYVSDWGTSHQVKVFSASGAPLRTIGTPGGPQLGLYDETRMHFPRGIAVTPAGELWVSEYDGAPKRISRWNAASGAFVEAFYGPSKYGGGGRFDPHDRSRFYYGDELYTQAGGVDNALMEFHVDWAARTSRPHRILWRKKSEVLESQYPSVSSLSAGASVPYRTTGEVSFHVNGRQYFTDAYQGTGNAEAGIFTIWMMDGDQARQVAVVGRIGTNGHGADPSQVFWNRLADPDITPLWNGLHRGTTMFVWSDGNFDREAQPAEFSFFQHPHSNMAWGSWYVAPDLSIVGRGGIRIPPTFDAQGVPSYDLADAALLATVNDLYVRDNQPGTRMPVVAGGRLVQMGGPIVGYSLATGRERWRYDNQWPGDYEVQPGPGGYSGQIKRTGRLLGPAFRAPQGQAGHIFAINGYYGEMYLMNAEGFFLATLGADKRTSPLLRANSEAEVAYLDGISPSDEHYWPGLHLADGRVYLTLGKERISIVELEGLETVQPLNLGTITVTPAMVDHLPATQTEGSDAQEDVAGTVHLRTIPPVVDGNLADWSGSEWKVIDPVRQIRAAVAIVGDTLYAAFDTVEPALLANALSGGAPYAFTTGGGLDLVLNVTGDTSSPRFQTLNNQYTHTPVAGDVRLFITRSGDGQTGAPLAVRYEQEAAEPHNPITYTSPIGQVTIRSVRDVSDQIALAQAGGRYEVAVPLSALGMSVSAGDVTLGDVGVVLGNGIEAQSRAYWSNKSEVHVSDVPSEARLTPVHWGTWTFAPGGDPSAEVPSVTLTQPASGATYEAPATIQLRAEAAPASGDGGAIARVRFLRNGVVIGEDTAAPYAYDWTGVPAGSYVLSAEAITGAGAVGVSETVTVHVSNPDGGPTDFQEIGLVAGWNLISSSIAPADSAMSAVFAGIPIDPDSGTITLMVKDALGRIFAPELAIDQIGHWHRGEAYAAFVAEPQQLSLAGTALAPEQTPIPLALGWNQPAYLRSAPLAPAAALESLGDRVVIVKDGLGGVFVPALGIDEIGEMLPGQGYKVYVDEAAVLVYPPDAQAASGGRENRPDYRRVASERGARPTRQTHAQSAAAPYPPGAPSVSNATLIVDVPAQMRDKQLVVRTGGGLQVGHAPLAAGRVIVTIWGDDNLSTEPAGAQAGERLHLVALGEKGEERLSVVDAEDWLTQTPLNTPLAFQRDGVWRVGLQSSPEAFELGQSYPNPFTSTTTITYALPRDTHVELQIFNVLGQRVATLVDEEQGAGAYSLEFDGRSLASGVYVYRLRAGASVASRRMIIAR